MTSNTGLLDEGLKNNLLVPVNAESIPGFPVDVLPQFIDDERQTARVWVAPFGVAYNTDSVSEDEVPKEWSDLLDPRWKGQIIFNPPSLSDSVADFYRFLDDEYGDDYVKQLAAQANRFLEGSTTTHQAVAAGEADLAVPGVASGVATLAATGAPIGFTFLNPALAGEVVVYPTEKAAHPNAARLFVHFLMSKAGNEAFNKDVLVASTTGGSVGGPTDIRFYGSPSKAMTDEERTHIISLVEGK
jgi:iron(III) transport system substrate-binding protein